MIDIRYLDFVVAIDENDGMNVAFVSWKGKTLIDGDVDRKAKGLTYGMPLMFPTPNRTKNNQYTYNNKQYGARMHGLLRNLYFEITCNCQTKDGYMVTGVLTWNSSYAEFEKYPFEFTLTIRIIIQHDVLTYEYDVQNIGETTLPYGFGIHPFFENPDGDAKVMIKANQMLAASERINTGEILDVKGTEYDLSKLKPVKSLNLDHVYMVNKTKDKIQEVARVHWHAHELILSCTDDFSHLVIYTPQNLAKFCVEPQTCSIDAFNLFNKGLLEISGVKEVSKQKKQSGRVKFEMKML